MSYLDEVRCPICERLLARNYVGFNAHLRVHIKAGEFRVEDRRNLYRQLFKGQPPTDKPDLSEARRRSEGFIR